MPMTKIITGLGVDAVVGAAEPAVEPAELDAEEIDRGGVGGRAEPAVGEAA
jgi:hypothetical protein